jgi:uncharacterized protein YbaP (TraB family)
MTLTQRLMTSAARLGRQTTKLALGVTLGAGLAMAITGVPGHAHAQSQTVEATTATVRAVPAAEGQGPALWVVSDADSTLYLFGTVHVLRPTTAWGSPRVDAAFDSASKVWLEISNPDDVASIMPLIQQHGISPDRPLSSLLTAEQFADLDAAARTIGLSGAQMEPMRPWLAAMQLSMAPLVKAGYDPQSGVELILKARAEAAGKPLHGLETIDKQIGILAGLDEADQLAFLTETLGMFDNAATELDQLVNAWATGDVDSINRLGVEEMKTVSPAVYEALLVRRNTDWANQIQTMLEGSGTVFIAVGAAHLAGDDSVQAILSRRGVTVTTAP